MTFLDWVVLHWEKGLRDGPMGLDEWESEHAPPSFVVLSLSYFIFVVLILGARQLAPSLPSCIPTLPSPPALA